ncbi:serine/threonine-protein kinase [Saccharopolyspora taberi]|uniref:non-specific serine/threonine protein kinase n=1 Tax=Saccharopolyspora taberi TaxID=60895 RepID=A0ABN3V0A3_9PSEU
MRTGTLLEGSYRITGHLSRGGMGEIYRAVDESSGNAVAVKVVHDPWLESTTWYMEKQERLISEGRLGQYLRGIRGIPTVHAVGRIDKSWFVVMELVEGRNLTEVLQNFSPLKRRTATAIAIQLGMILEAAHRKEVVHRDVKPDNVLLDDEGMVHLLDLGIALRWWDKPRPAGSRGYAPVEQVKGTAVDQRSDIYALGCLICKMVTNSVPYGKKVNWNVGDEVAEFSEKTTRRLGPGLADLVREMVERDLDRRPGTMGEVLKRLRSSLPEPDSRLDPQAPEYDPERWLRKHLPQRFAAE